MANMSIAQFIIFCLPTDIQTFLLFSEVEQSWCDVFSGTGVDQYLTPDQTQLFQIRFELFLYQQGEKKNVNQLFTLVSGKEILHAETVESSWNFNPQTCKENYTTQNDNQEIRPRISFYIWTV